MKRLYVVDEKSARRAPTQERSRRTVHRILEAAEQIIGEAGIDAATTRAIAERAEVAVPSLYRFFADRDEIFDALLEQILVDFDDRTEEAEAAWQPTSVEELIGLVLDLHVGFYEEHPTAATLWFGGRVSPTVAQAVHARNHRLAVRLHRLISQQLLDGSGVAAGSGDFLLEEADLLVELGDRVLELAFRHSPTADQRVLGLGRAALAAAATRLATAVTT